MTPYFLAFAIVCVVLGIGLTRRPLWMWYVGWALLYLFAAYVGQWFLAALYYADDLKGAAYACFYLGGGLVLWIPSAIWWSKNRHRFGPRAPSKAVQASGSRSTGDSKNA